MDYMQVFSIVLYVLGAILLTVLIVLCIKFMYTADKLNIILTDVSKKLKSVDGVFEAIDSVTSAVSTLSDTFVSKVLLFIERLFKKRKDDSDE